MRHPYAYLLAALLYMAASCNSDNARLQMRKQADSLSLKVAVMPTADCLPIYYAEQNGLFSGEGVDVRLFTYHSLMDCDTAFARGQVELAYTDMIRATALQSQGCGLHVIAGLPGEDVLVTARSKRIRTLGQLQERMIGMARNSQSDFLTDCVQDSAGLGEMDLYRPQINDVILRTDMVCNATLDAAFLPEPHAARAICEGNRRLLHTTTWPTPANALVLAHSAARDSNRTDQVLRFLRAYRQAAEEISGQVRPDSIRALLVRHYRIPSDMADTMKIAVPDAQSLSPVHPADTVIKWMRHRQLLPAGYNTDTLIDYRFITQ